MPESSWLVPETVFLSDKTLPETTRNISMDRFVSVSEMCDILGISKSRLYTLIRDGILPTPYRNPSNNRPVFDSALTEACRQVMKTGIGANGQPYTPNRKRATAGTNAPGRRKHDEIITALAGLGVTATPMQVADAMRSLPDSGKHLEQSELIKKIFLHLRQNG